MNSTNLGGSIDACVAKRIFGCLPPRTGGGVGCTSSVRNALSLAVGTRVDQESSACLQRRDEPVHVPAGLGGDVDPQRPRSADELAVDLLLQVVAAVLVDAGPTC